MKTVILLNRWMLIIIAFLCLSPVLILSQNDNIIFKGYSYRAHIFGKPIGKSIAKINVTNNLSGKSIDIQNRPISKDELITVGVKEDSLVQNPLKLINLEYNYRCFNVSVVSRDEMEINVEISDINGRNIADVKFDIFKDFNNLIIPVSEILNGFYFINFKNRNGVSISRNSLVVSGYMAFLNKTETWENDIMPQKLNEIMGFRFIAYPESTKHLPDTVFVESISHVDTIAFYFKDKADFNYRMGSIKVVDIEADIQEIFEIYNKDGSISESSKRQILDTISLDYELGVLVASPPGVKSCTEVFNIDNIVKFCNIGVAGNYLYLEYSRIRAELLIDTSDSTIKLLGSERESSNNIAIAGLNDVIYSNFAMKKSIPYTINPNTGDLEAEIYLNEAEFNFYIYSTVSKSNPDFENNYLENKRIRTCKSFKFLEGRTKLNIVLNP